MPDPMRALSLALGGTAALEVRPLGQGRPDAPALCLALLLPCVQDAARLGYGQLRVEGDEALRYRALAPLLGEAHAAGMVTILAARIAAAPGRWPAIAPFVDVAEVALDTEGAAADIAAVRACGVPLHLTCTLAPRELDRLPGRVRQAAGEGAAALRIRISEAHEVPARAAPDPARVASALCAAQRLGLARGLAVHVQALSRGQVRAHRDALVPRQPPASLVEAAPRLFVEPDSRILPVARGVDPALALGRLAQATLPALAAAWLHDGRAARLAAAAQRAWEAVANDAGVGAVYWYDAVAHCTRASGPPSAPPAAGVLGESAWMRRHAARLSPLSS